MFITFKKGEIARIKVLLRAAEKGVLVSIPVVESRYDLIVDDGNKLLRVQVKYAGSSHHTVSGSVTLDLRKKTRGCGAKKTYTKDEVDLILVYIPSIDKVVYLLPDDFHQKQGVTLRFDKSGNGQAKGTLDVQKILW